ncbi:C40 family peptidase [Bifidobacterium sp. ESL0827]|uniref:C40 family peptidase n=1 Tax=Bifidobacterium sp. ESL0827 TaxID=3448583 RepID=UPI004041C6E9
MKKTRKYVSIMAAATISGMLSIGIPAVAQASDGSEAAVTSSRSFTPGSKVRADLLTESTATTVEKDSSWGGIESLNVPATKSQAEKDAETRAQQAQEQAQTAASRRQSAQQVSRSSARASTPNTVTDVPVSGTGADVVNYALQFQGIPYVFGGTDPATGFDCSGFTQYVFAHFGIGLPRIAAAQGSAGVPVTDPAPGDLMVALDGSHVGIYVGGGRMIHAPSPGQSVKVQAVYQTFNYRRLV